MSIAIRTINRCKLDQFIAFNRGVYECDSVGFNWFLCQTPIKQQWTAKYIGEVLGVYVTNIAHAREFLLELNVLIGEACRNLQTSDRMDKPSNLRQGLGCHFKWIMCHWECKVFVQYWNLRWRLPTTNQQSENPASFWSWKWILFALNTVKQIYDIVFCCLSPEYVYRLAPVCVSRTTVSAGNAFNNNSHINYSQSFYFNHDLDISNCI